MEYAVDLAAPATNAGQVHAARLPFPFLSCTYDDPVRNARDMVAGGCQFNGAAVQLADVASVADALAAVEQVVFRERRVSLGALLEATRRNWENAEPLRQLCLRRAPKFGNDDPTVDAIAARVAELFAALVRRQRTHFGDPYLPMVYNVTTASVQAHGPRTGALPDGRRAGEPLPAALNPYQGRDTRGPAAAFRSVTTIDAKAFPGGTSFITELHPSYLAGREGQAKFAAMLRAFFAMGGQNLAVNVVDAATLRAAQHDPEHYRHLSVRLFGYSEYFVNLDRELQDYVIAKCEREGCAP
jgi:formate C-acetyltransferase